MGCGTINGWNAFRLVNCVTRTIDFSDVEFFMIHHRDCSVNDVAEKRVCVIKDLTE